ncbi:3'-5' exoribonuclease HELZ2 [Aquarana catesbeiana]|uniref:3'-5' exoribonuclease HELZ2 n=1 Tax=Aquarana catesbeiana TaxID=8400 RepID=UPI003CC9BD04
MGQFAPLVPPDVTPLLATVELRLACAKCSKRLYEITYTYNPVHHSCNANLLLSRSRNAKEVNEWHEVRRRPAYPVPARYAICWHYRPTKGCILHYQKCNFAWTEEEVHIWSFEKHHNLERSHLQSILLNKPIAGASLKELSSWEDILGEFGGRFQYICEQCFHQSPRKVTLTSLCQSHPRPVPLLAHIVTDNDRKQCNAIRPVPYVPHVQLCAHSSRGLLCREEIGHCPKAHSEVELAVWKIELKYGLSRSLIQEEDGGEDIGFYCRLCLVRASTQESFEAHCSSLEHERMLKADSSPVWNHRDPPDGMKRFLLCQNPSQCIYGEGCGNAHSQEELEEWILRVKVSRRNRQVVEEEGLLSYRDQLLQEFHQSSSDMPVLSEEGESIQGVKVSCDSPLKIQSNQKPVKNAWNFTVHSKMPLQHVALLKMDPGAAFSLRAQGLPDSCQHAHGHWFQVRSSRTYYYKVEVSAECSVFGVFEKWLTMDFGIRPILLQKIFVQVGCQEEIPSDLEKSPEQDNSPLTSSERWIPGKQLWIPCKERAHEEEKLLNMYKPPSMNPSYGGRTAKQQALTVENYREVMHIKVLQEEAAREEIIARLNLKADVTLTRMLSLQNGEMKFSSNGELFAKAPLPKGLTKDTEEGYLLQRSVPTALVAPSLQQGDKVYEVHMELSSELDGSVVLRIPERCCRELSLHPESSVKMEIQFQLDRLPFCVYHEAIDRLLDVALLLPDLSRCCVPTSEEQMSWGNSKQKMAISYITERVTGKQPVAPLVIYGPFGTGKTSTMAKAALQVIKQAGTRVLICTHNNSAADLYIEEHFDPYVKSGHPEATPLRLKYTLSPVNRTTPITLLYCALTDDQSCFVKPTKGLLDKHRIVVTTAVTARDLDVPRGYFTHILLDEAAQMMESEALIPLALMNHKTRVVVAGDHMQETPRFFHRTNVEEHTLLTRLFTHYQSKDCPAAKNSRIVFHQNYRSVPAITSFVSRCFYVGRDDAIEACAVQPMEPPPGCQALALFHVHGQCSAEGNSWINVLEAQQVVETVKDVLQRWPQNWGKVNGSKICVVSHGSQVVLIRQELRKVRLSHVIVNNYDNIIGQEFFVIILSTVRSVDSLPAQPPTYSTFSLDFFCDPRILNTILTRARAQVIVVGDVVALCSFGACSRIWRSYLRECLESGSANPPDLSVEGIKQMASDLQAWKQQEEEEDTEEDSDSWTTDVDINAEDAILQELLDSKNEACVTVSAEGMLEMRPTVSSKKDVDKYTNFPTHTLEQYLIMQPNIYKKCHLVKEDFDRGYAVTLDDPVPRHIAIHGRENCSIGFSGDQVVVELFPNVQPDKGKVVGVLNAGEEIRRFVCYMDTYDSNIMVPVDRTVTKIYCPKFKEKPNFIPIREYRNGRVATLGFEKVTQEMRRNTIFLVQVVRWREGFYYPLGIVTQVFPQNLTLENGLEILDLEYGIEHSDEYPKKALEEANNLPATLKTKDRKDCRKIVTFTVDPSNAKDLDDAISVQEQGEYYEIGIHITDLAAVVPQGGDLDSEAQRRGVTFYSPGNEPVHMLPHKLCSDLCSLKPHCDRMAISFFVLVEKKTDQIVSGHFCRSVICSDRQLSYEEANSILEDERDRPRTFVSIEGCLCITEHFAKIHRAFRLEKTANYKQPDEGCMPGSRDARMMIEELMIMYNSWAADYLTNTDEFMNLTPLRCQNGISLQKIEEMRRKFEHVLPLSAYLSHHLLAETELPKPSSEQKFTMLASVWNQLQDPATSHSKITDLLSTDDLHPELSYAVREFRSQLGRSYFTRSGTPNANGHYSLQVDDYTWASSPLRRYIDIVVQRLLQGILTGNPDIAFRISPKNMDLLCLDFNRKVKRESSYEKKAHSLKFALSLRKVVQQKIAVVMTIDVRNRSLKAIFPLDGDSLTSPMKLDYCHLQPEKQPEPTENGLLLTWRRRVYSYNNYKDEPLSNLARKDIVSFNPYAWHEAIKAIGQGQPEEALASLKYGREKSDQMSFVTRSKCGHYIEISLELRAGESLPIQFCTVTERGLPSPSLQLCTLAPGIHLCLEHTSRPIECFSKLANRAPLKTYRNVKEYQNVWLPLCAMEAAECAVKEGASIILRDVPINWMREGGSKQSVGLKGTFTLTPLLIKECDLEMDFQNCYLCVRLEGLPAEKTQNPFDLQSYTWVAHGLTESTSFIMKEKGGDVDFKLHQCNMHEVPEKALRSTDPFTMEIIPKLLPDIRKERAVRDLNKASELTKSIVLGKQVPDVDMNKKFKTQKLFTIPERPRPLNESQTGAVRKALTQPFTLIQGPPGTGKTVVGVHLAYWFHHINQCAEIAADNEAEEEEVNGRRVLMYCGPSNKSVDVVSEMLLPLRDRLHPVRVYSEQMELSEFPYPGSNLKVTGYLREGKPNETLRPIALHHLIREPSKPHSKDIRQMDQRIRDGEEMSQEDIDMYKALIADARKEELKHHDIILCTCVASSSNMLTEVPITQVVIDECGMCTEPESLVPLVSHKGVQSIVLIGDHRQLRPVVINEVCKLLKMDRSLFERYEERALFLDTQYRMHLDICMFPSREFYNDRLRTSPQQNNMPNSLFFTRKFHRIVFGEVNGQEQSLMVTTAEGNISSKANLEEANEAVRLAALLVLQSIEQSEIAILTAYNAQVSEISKRLQAMRLSNVTVSTIMKSQGSEWRYVIFSTVRSASAQDLDSHPTIGWQRRYLGFLSDPNQINVALTRAKEGLCILGNSKLLWCCPMWKRLLQHYIQRGAHVPAAEIMVVQNRRR